MGLDDDDLNMKDMVQDEDESESEDIQVNVNESNEVNKDLMKEDKQSNDNNDAMEED